MDSFGLKCPKDVIKVSNTLNISHVYNSTQYQDFFSGLCLYYMNVHSMGKTCYNAVKMFSPTDYACNKKFIKQYFIMGILTGNHCKIDSTVEGVEGPAGQPGPRDDKGDTGPKRDKGDTGAQGTKGDKGDKGDTGEQGPPGSAGAGSQGPKGDKGDTTAQGPKGDVSPQGPKGDKGDTGPQGPKGDKDDSGVRGRKGYTGDTGAQGPKGDKGERGPQGPSGSGDSAGLLTVLLSDGTQIMTGNWHMNSKNVVNLGDPSGATDASNKRIM